MSFLGRYLLLFVAVAGCQPAETAPLPRRPVVLAISGDTRGWIVPCGCTSNQSGGLPRRATWVAAVRGEADVVLADAGGAAAGTSAYDRLRLEFILRGEAAMEVAAHNIGAAEAALGAAYLREVAGRLGVPLVSANVCDARGKPVAEPWRVVPVGGRRVALVGVLSPEYAGGEIRVSEPRQAILEVLPRIPAHDRLVVLAYLPADELETLARTLPEADVVAGGPTGQPLVPRRIGATTLVSATNKGKFLVRLGEAGTPGSWRCEVIELNERFADDPSQVANLKAFYAELARRDFGPEETSFVDPLLVQPDFALAGTDACRKCHEEESRLWDASRHARAWESLCAKGSQVDPECQRCHTTGYGMPGGFRSARAAAMVHVGCESCHGPSRAHAAEPTEHTPRYRVASHGCIDCHDPENSPQFNLPEYWARIAHGGDASPSEEAP